MARTKKKAHGGKKSKVVIPIWCSFCLVVEEFALCETWFAFWQLSLWKAGSCWLKITFFTCAFTTLFPLAVFFIFFSQKKQTSRGLKLAAKFAVFVALHFLCFFRAAVSLFFFLSFRKEMVPEDCILVVATKLTKNVLGGMMTRPPGTMSCKWEKRRMPFSSLSSQPRFTLCPL